MSGMVVSLDKERRRRHPVRYAVAVNHDEQGRWIQVNNIADTKKDRLAVAADLEAAARAIRSKHGG